MTDFVEYIVSELKNKRLTKESALDLVRQFSARSRSGDQPSKLHPLLHRNASDLYQQCYASTFTGDEFFLNDHRVMMKDSGGLKVLPGVAYLELARAAVADALPNLPESHGIRLQDIVWQKPLIVDGPADLFVSLSLADSDSGSESIEFEIFSAEPADDGQRQEVLHCQGFAVVEEVRADALDIEAIASRTTGPKMDAVTVYAAYERMGMWFGPAHRPVHLLFSGEGEVLARLKLPDSLGDTLTRYLLHPSLVDGALQSALGLLQDSQLEPGRPPVPFALDSIRILSGCAGEMYAWIRRAADSAVSDRVSRLDIDLCDTQGRVCAQLRGFTSRTLEPAPSQSAPSSTAEPGLVIASPVWREIDVEVRAAPPAEHHVLLCGLAELDERELQGKIPGANLHLLQSPSDDLAKQFVETVVPAFEVLRERLAARPLDALFIHIVIPDTLQGNLLASLSGLLKSAELEQPSMRGQLLQVEVQTTADELASRLLAEADGVPEPVVRYRAQQRQVLRWQELPAENEPDEIAFREDGVYLITGGLGGLGALFTREILRRTRQARVILTGRAAASPEVAARLDAVTAGLNAGKRVAYRPLDLADSGAVHRCIEETTADHGRLNGIIHSAGMVADRLIRNKTSEEFLSVLAPKVFGALNLDSASEGVDLDFLVLFASGASVRGNVGQSDYAVANAFLDQFADYRNRLVAAGQRRGRTLSIDWPLWRDGGMQMPAREQDSMRELSGMQPMRTETGMTAFHRSLGSDRQQVLVLEGETDKIRQLLFDAAPGGPENSLPAVSASTSADCGVDLAEQTADYLRKQFAALLKLPYHKVDARAPLEKYGIDSILAMDLTRQLEKRFGSLSKTLFFEHQTIEELAEYFLREHEPALKSLFGTASVVEPVKTGAEPGSVIRKVERSATRGRRSSRTAVSINRNEPVAIVGLSGRYPEAENVEAFWENLRDGRDCITEIPRERWDWRDYYSEDRTAEGAHYSKWGGFISGVDEFDPLFFGIPPVDADLLDPQERLFLQHAWMAVEDAGYTRADLQQVQAQAQAGQVGVYAGVMYGEYQLFGAELSMQGKRLGVPVSYASIANRVSYIMNLHGPSMTLDSMCSSSLTAIHLACQDLRLGRTGLAIAGGVNVTIHPNKYLILSAGQYISSDGHCQSFGEGGDGYIPGEGVGVVLLKRLADAERDGNHIYGIIRGSALNHGGKTNGYSVPNPKAQAEVIAQALKESGTDPRHLSYIEAHGTGTKLGDPIEISALTQVFRRTTEEKQFCALGSAKSNIGHCESAAGIAGLTKILLQMKHGSLVPSLHSSVLNPHIDFESSPFVVNQSLQPWHRPEIDGRRLPRIAGISSFGAGGSNAHLIIEEYSSSHLEPVGSTPAIIPLSARTADQLKQKARDLLEFIARREGNVSLQAMAYTLQVGRESMDHRLACVVDSVTALLEKLEAFLDGDMGIDQLFHDRAEKDADGMSLISRDEDMLEAVDKWIARGKRAKLAELWVRGFDFDWRKLHAGQRPPLISLPTYPFAKDRHWVTTGFSPGLSPGARVPQLHPLVHTNTSDFQQQSYRSEFSGREFFLADHRVDATGGATAKKILPGVAYLEMARAAIDLASPTRQTDDHLEIRNVAWAQPLIVEERKGVSVRLTPRDKVTVDFEVESEQIIHCQGQVALVKAAPPARLDLDKVRERMIRGQLAVDELYRAYADMGIHYGPAFRGIASLARGEDEVLAMLDLKAAPEADDSKWVLHPALLDSALQTAIGLLAEPNKLPKAPPVPFALDAMTVHGHCPQQMFAWVRHAEPTQAARDIDKIDIDLCDSDGRICVQIRGLTSRAIPLESGTGDPGLLFAVPVWEAPDAQAAAPAYDRHLVLLCGFPEVDMDRLGAGLKGAETSRLTVENTTDSAVLYRQAALAAFEKIRAILRKPPQGRTLFQLLIADEGDGELLAGLAGLLHSARLENPGLSGQLLLTSAQADEQTLTEQLLAAWAQPAETLFRYDSATPQVLRWHTREWGHTVDYGFRNGGIYMITGGLGGLGGLFAREILEHAEGATVVLTGRREADVQSQARVEALATEFSLPSGRLVYRQLDLSDQDSVDALISQLRAEYGSLTGILHSAGMVRDSLIVNKTSGEFAQVLEPKVAGTRHLDLATREMDLDFFVLFSSLASAVGNPGQADYATANGFMDAYVGYRNALVKAGERRGRTLSIHWPLWKEGGMQLDREARERLAEASGMVPLTTPSGMRAFHHCLASGAERVLVVEGDVARLRHSLEARRPAPEAGAASHNASSAANVDAAPLHEQTQCYLIDEFAALFGMPAHEVNARAPLENYGMDSVLAMKLTSKLERSFGSLSKTLFFEYQTIADLAGYLVKTFPDRVREKTGAETANAAAPDPTSAGAATGNRFLAPAQDRLRAFDPATTAEDEVAIIGVSGRYPQANNLEEFWENLKGGRDCITEIPAERWDHGRIFHPARNQPGKTYSKWGGFLTDVDRFDALFFNISPREAELIDPQERLCLETVWETIEDAGYSKDAIAANRVGVYVGVMWGQYELYGAASAKAGVPSSSFASVANRISYFFNFQGPSLALDTMCSSSLTAIHLACEEIRKGAIDVAVAAGVNLTLHPGKYLSLSQGNFASTDGRCRSFGEGGDGYVPGEGVGAVLLKPLSRAMEDGDQIYGVIKASSINHGGKTNGYTVPNPVAQSDLIRDALKKADLDAASIDYIEAHGTGTALGDPVEVNGLLRAFDGADGRNTVARQRPCAIGSVKSNIGHLESAAGIAALTKVLLQFKHRQLAPSLHAEHLNPNIDFETTPFRVQRRLEDWPEEAGRPRRAGISSFGAGGSNAHLIVDEFIDTRERSNPEPRAELVLLSAKTRSALKAYAERMAVFLSEVPQASLADIAFTSQVGRTPMQERLALLVSDVSVLRQKLQAWVDNSDDAPKPGTVVEGVYHGSTRNGRAAADAAVGGEAEQGYLERAQERRELAGLAKLWVAGVEIDWTRMYRTERPSRISLPTYPFERERYWLEVSSPFITESAPERARQMLYCRTAWEPEALPGAAGMEPEKTSVLILGRSPAVSDELLRAGYRVESVSHLNEANFTGSDDGLAATDRLPTVVVHIADTVDDVDAQLDNGIHALHSLCRALMRHKPKHVVKIISLRREAPAVPAALHQALAAYLKSLVLENPKFAWKLVSAEQSATDAEVAGFLQSELVHDDWVNAEVRYLYEGKWQRQTKRVLRYKPTADSRACVKQQGVYLITGGLGGLGYLFSRHLAERYRARLVLTGRSVLDAGLRAKLDTLRTLGGEAFYVQADVADASQADNAFREAKIRFGGVDGIIHSAGINRDAFVLNKQWDDIQSVLAAKVQGTLNLDAAARSEELDLFVLFSSVAGAFGNAGQADYAYANAFMDAFAAGRQALVEAGERCGKTLSINWPFWEDGGMQLSASDLELTEERAGIAALPTTQGLRCWETFLQGDEAQAIPLYGDAERIDAFLTRLTTPPGIAATSPVAESQGLGALHAAVEHYLKQLLGEEIKLPADRIDGDEAFSSFGVDSMMISRINGQLEKDLGELPKTLFYEYSTIAELSDYLVTEVRPALERHLKVAASSRPGLPAPTAGKTARIAEPASTPLAAERDTRIAIIGLHGQFPRSESLNDYWHNLREGRSLIDLVPESRWDRDAFFDADPARAEEGKIYCKWGGFLQDVDKFDAAFFGITTNDAKVTDPQERLFMQSVWAAVEDAGYTRDSLRKRYPKDGSADVAVFVGVTTNSYHQLTPDEWHRGNMTNAAAMPWSIANRVSYFFDFKGPSMPVDTACSSSLTAIHLACESLNRGECQVAVAGGVNLYLHPAKYQSLCRRGMLATDDRCRSFGAGGDGFIPGEGVGAVLLKPLAKAIEDGDHIHGVISGSACEHSGRSNGYSSPNPNSQAAVIEEALKRSAVSPETISYVEGHGTGTELGDNLEVVSLTQAFRKHTDKTAFCALGSVKANCGHAESAAGMAGLTKILLQFKHQGLVPSIHSDEKNPNIDFARSPFYLQHQASPWKAAGDAPRRAMINSFGAGGVNASLVVEERPPQPTGQPASGGPQLIVVSAKNNHCLRIAVSRLRDYLNSEPDADLARVAYTLQVGRETMEQRLAVVVANITELRLELDGYLQGRASAKLTCGRVDPHKRRKLRKAEERSRINALYREGELEALGHLWVEGQDVDWDDLYTAGHPPRLPLPTYPFAKERHWVSDSAPPAPQTAPAESTMNLHPLVSRNVSTLRETCFASLLTAQAYYGRDHKVDGSPIFPGAGFLEIAAISGAVAGEEQLIRIEDIVWVQPLYLRSDGDLTKTFLRANGAGAEFVTASFDDDNERVVHAEGRVIYGDRDGSSKADACDIAKFQERSLNIRTGADCYRTLASAGFDYGPSFQTIQELYEGEGFALSKLSLAEALRDSFEQYILHPTLIDGALQTVVGLASSDEPGASYLPFAMDAVEILRPLSASCYALAELATSMHSAGTDIKQFNIQLLDENGTVLVRLNNFYVRALRASANMTNDTDELVEGAAL